MPAEPVGLGLDQRWAFPPPCAVDGRTSNLVDGFNIVAIYDHPWHAVSGCPVGDILDLECGRERGRSGVEVILADVYHRKVPDGSQVHRFVDGALVGCPIAKEADRHPVVCQPLGGQSSTGGDGCIATDDGDGREHADGDVADVHRPALGLAAAGAPGEQLGHDAPG